MFSSIGSFCVRRRRLVVAVWIGALVLLGGLSTIVGNDVRTEFDLPDVESRAGFEVLDDSFGGFGAGATGSIVFQSDAGFDDPALRSEIESFLAAIDDLPDSTITSPFAPAAEDPALAMAAMTQFLGDEFDPTMLGGQERISEDGTIAYADVELPGETVDQDRTKEFSDDVMDLEPDIDGVRIEYGGQIFGDFEPPASELLGLAFAIVILILATGSVLAMGLPIGVALAGIGIGATLIMLLSNVMSMPDFAATLGIMIGLGVGIDYALFIVTRYREQLHAGHTVAESVSIALDTSGRAVTFAGVTVVISLMGMLLMGVSFVNGLAVGSATVVTVTLLASLTLLPALLGFVGERIEVSRWRGIIAALFVVVALIGLGLKVQPLLIGFPIAAVVLIAGLAVAPLKRKLPSRRVRPLRETFAYRWSRVVQARPWTIAIGSAAVLVIAALPVLSMRLGFSDAGNDPEQSSTRQAYDLLAEGFGPGSNGPLLLVTELDGAVDPAGLVATTEAIASTPGVEAVTGPIPNSLMDPSLQSATAALWQVQPSTAPQDAATTDLVNTLRDEVLPSVEPAGTDVMVTGFVAVTVDFSEYLSARLPWFFAAVLSLSFVLLMVVFRSVLVPLKAVIMNLLSIGAAYGLMVAFFQWGWGRALMGIESAPIEPFLPMVLFAIVFGLSMDYEVFLLSRIHEEWVRTGDSRTSVADGLAATARVITAAAAIMVFVFGSFILEDTRAVKLMGFGLAVAVLLDATIVRMLLVPATMELLGDKNWWLPRWLDRIIPHIDVEGSTDRDDEVREPGDDIPERDREREAAPL